MGQFKPMVKMETTEPSVILKLKKGGHVSSDKDENGHTNMKGAGFKAKYSEEACEGESPKKPSMMDRRKAMSGSLLNSKKGGKAEKKAMGGMMGSPAMAAPMAASAMDPRKAAMLKAMMARKAAMRPAPAAPMAAPAAPGMPAMKKGGKADMGQDKAMVKKAFKQHDMQEHKGGKGTKLKLATGGVTNGMKTGGKVSGAAIDAAETKTTIKGDAGAFKKTKMVSAKKDSGYEEYATGGVVNGMKKGGATKKHFATGGSVSTGRAVAMPKHPVSKPVSNDRQSGTFKEGGKVAKFQVGGGTGTGNTDMGTDMTGGGYDKVYTDQTDDNTKLRESILGLPNKFYSASRRLLGMKPDAGAGRGNVNPPLVRKSGGSAKR